MGKAASPMIRVFISFNGAALTGRGWFQRRQAIDLQEMASTGPRPRGRGDEPDADYARRTGLQRGRARAGADVSLCYSFWRKLAIL